MHATSWSVTSGECWLKNEVWLPSSPCVTQPHLDCGNGFDPQNQFSGDYDTLNFAHPQRPIKSYFPATDSTCCTRPRKSSVTSACMKYT